MKRFLQYSIHPYPYLLILLSLQQVDLIFSSTNPLLDLQQLYPKILDIKLHHICFSFLSDNREYFSKQKSLSNNREYFSKQKSRSNNREYFSKQKFNRYLNPYPYLLILLSLQQLNLIFPSTNPLLG